MNYQYSYLIGDLIALAIWLLLYLWRKDTRKEMLIISLIFGLIGPLYAIPTLIDWWNPPNITNTPIGIEDFLFGFVIGGISAIIYEEIFKKRVKIRKVKEIKEKQRNLNILSLVLLNLGLYFGSFYLLKINSFFSTVISLAITIPIIYLKRKDLIINSLATGLLITIIGFVGYSLVEIINPGYILFVFNFGEIPKIIILNVPLYDLIWLFLFGAFIGPLYEYWKEGKLINIKK